MTGTPPKNWYAIDILIDDTATEAAESALNDLGAIGTEIIMPARPTGEPLCVSGYFDELPEIDDVTDAVDEALTIHGFSDETVKRIDGRSIEQSDWLAEWKKHWKPTVIDDFVIAPPWEPWDDDSKIVIRIEPNMAFGTGTHETTQLCLRAIGRELRDGDTFLDVGTGTGILAIAAAKLGERRIVACDTDEDAVMIAIENAQLNNVGGQIAFFPGSIDARTGEFDLVCANLTIDVIIPILDTLLSCSKRLMLLSGILDEQLVFIDDALQQRNITNFEIEKAGDWISVLVRLN